MGAVEHWYPSSKSCCWLTFLDRLSGKIAGLHSNWKRKVQASSRVQPLSTTASVSTSTTATFTASAQSPENLSANYLFEQVTNMNTSTNSNGQNLNPVSNGDNLVFPEQAVVSGREIGLDEDNELLTSAGRHQMHKSNTTKVELMA